MWKILATTFWLLGHLGVNDHQWPRTNSVIYTSCPTKVEQENVPFTIQKCYLKIKIYPKFTFYFYWYNLPSLEVLFCHFSYSLEKYTMLIIPCDTNSRNMYYIFCQVSKLVRATNFIEWYWLQSRIHVHLSYISRILVCAIGACRVIKKLYGNTCLSVNSAKMNGAETFSEWCCYELYF